MPMTLLCFLPSKQALNDTMKVSNKQTINDEVIFVAQHVVGKDTSMGMGSNRIRRPQHEQHRTPKYHGARAKKRRKNIH
eukprot:scaffold70397_cov21-Tisochrysis_lutea.AAC.1